MDYRENSFLIQAIRYTTFLLQKQSSANGDLDLNQTLIDATPFASSLSQLIFLV